MGAFLLEIGKGIVRDSEEVTVTRIAVFNI